jgi:hypothetical protein
MKEIPVKLLPPNFEYKFILQENDNKIDRWESGENHIFNRVKIHKLMQSFQDQTNKHYLFSASSFERGKGEHKKAEIKFTFENKDYAFLNNTLTILDNWRD